MTIGAREINWVVGRDLVELRSRRKLRRLPESLYPAPACDPFSALGLRGALFHFREKIFPRVRALEIQSRLAIANFKDVAMRISEAGHECVTMKIDNAGGAKFLRVFI